MENRNIFKKNFLTISHAPTLLLIIGYSIFWIELYIINVGKGRVSPLASIVFITYMLFVLSKKGSAIKNISKQLKFFFVSLKNYERWFLIFLLVFIFFMSICIFKTLLLPVHLVQEFDSLNYHITIPKQHLILHSFRHLQWSAADLRILPLEFALAPYWLVTWLPNKFSQLLFVCGLLCITFNIVYKLTKNNILPSLCAVIAVAGSHAFGIQMGALMLDLPICYLFIASIDSFLNGAILLSAIEFSFFLWSKAFIPIQIIGIVFLLFLFRYTSLKLGINKISLGFNTMYENIYFNGHHVKRFILYGIVISFFITGPFLAKSIYYAGTPLYPFSPGSMHMPHIDTNSSHWKSIVRASELSLNLKDTSGSGRAPLDFIKHFWLISVPEKGVLNRYDYPLGLPYLLFLPPFLYLLIKSLYKKNFPALPLFAIVYWGTWWFGSQQSRFLYVPLIVIFITVSAKFKRPAAILWICLFISLAINALSFFRAHYKDWKKSSLEVLRERDRELVSLNEKYCKSSSESIVVLPYYDVAFADFPVSIAHIKDEDLYWVLEH